MELIEKHCADSPGGCQTFDCTLRLAGREIDIIRYALLYFAQCPGAVEDKTCAMELYREFWSKC